MKRRMLAPKHRRARAAGGGGRFNCLPSIATAWIAIELAALAGWTAPAAAQGPADDRPPTVPIAREALAASFDRLTDQIERGGGEVPQVVGRALQEAAKATQGLPAQHRLDSHVGIVIRLNPESRVRCYSGPRSPHLSTSQPLWMLVKIINDCGSRAELRIATRETGEVAPRSEFRWVPDDPQSTHRWPRLSGAEVEYRWLEIACADAGWREVTIGFDVGAGTQDIGFRGETALLLRIAE